MKTKLIDVTEKSEHKEVERSYMRYIGHTLVQKARLKLCGIGKFAFETSNFGTKPYEPNMNMPLFDTEEEAYNWIENTGQWTKCQSCKEALARSVYEEEE